MWRVASLFVGKSRLSSASFLHLNPAAALPLHTSPIQNSHILNLTRDEVISLLSVKCKTGFDRVDDAHDLFHRMLQFVPLPFVADFSRLLNGLLKTKHYSSAILIYRDMCFHRVPIDGWTMSIAINSFCHLNQVDFGFSILSNIFKLGSKPDVVTLSTLIGGLFKAHRIGEAMDLFHIMVIQKGCTEITYGTVINGLCKSGNTFKAIEVLRLIEKQGPFKPNTVMYNTIIDSLCKYKKVDKALELLSEMAANATPSDIITYTSVIQVLCNFAKWKEVRRLMMDMERMRIYPDVFTFSVLVDAFSKQGLVEEAEIMLKIMMERGVRPDAATYNALMNGYILRGEMDNARQVLQIMVVHGSQPNIQNYRDFASTMIQGLFEADRYDYARKLIIEMQSQGVSPNSFTRGP